MNNEYLSNLYFNDTAREEKVVFFQYAERNNFHTPID